MPNVFKFIAISVVLFSLAACGTSIPSVGGGPISAPHDVRMTVNTPCGLFKKMEAAPLDDRQFRQLYATDRRCQEWYRIHMREIQQDRRHYLETRRQVEQERRSAHQRQRNWSREARTWIGFFDRLGGRRRGGGAAW